MKSYWSKWWAPLALAMAIHAAPQQAPTEPASNAANVRVSQPKPDRGVPEEYEIGAGDLLGIFVWKEPDASVPSVVVRPDGKIALPLLKEVAVAGLTPRAAEQRIAEGLSKLIVSGVDVTVVVTAVNSKKIYIMGAVKREGAIPYSYRMTVMQAIAEAGGLNDFAKRKKIYVLRGNGAQQAKLAFNYDDVIRGINPSQNVELAAGDTVVIPH